MRQLPELVDSAAAAVVAADPSDLRGLASLHTLMQEVEQRVAEAGGGADPALREVAVSAERLIEQIILAEVDDTRAALRAVADAVTRIQTWVAAGPQELVPPVPSPDSAATASQLPPPNDTSGGGGSESPLNAEDLPLIHEFIAEAREHITAAEAAVLRLEAGEEDPDAVHAIFRSFHTIKGVAGFLNLRQIGALSHAAESLLDLARQGLMRLDPFAIELVLEAIDATKALVGGLEEATRSSAPPPPHPGLDDLLGRLAAAARGERPAPAAAPASAVRHAAAAVHPEDGAGAERNVKVTTERLDALIDMVGELVIAQSMVSQDIRSTGGASQRLNRNMAHLGKIARELQDLSMSMRMVPVQGVFQKMARLVRDLAQKIGKQIEFVVFGGETELDRNVVEAISDPLVHMVRNAIDHGIEPPEERHRAGKPRAGRVELQARHEAGKIVIEISDDGRGLIREKILRKAVQNGLAKEGEELTDAQVFELIFAAGLSTSEKVTELSGRGVGMDVVKRNIEALRGRIDIRSTEGQGSTFTIRLPLTLAVIDALVVRVGTERYLVPTMSVEQSVRPTRDQLYTVQGRGEMCLLRGTLLPLVRLHRLFGVTPRTEDPTEALVVTVQDDHRRGCLLVDELLDQQQVVIKSLGDGIGAIPGVSGGAILGDGSISLILDVPAVLSMACGGG